MSDTILVPIELDTDCDDLIARAKDLGAKIGAEVILVHVHRPPMIGFPELPPTMVSEVVEQTYTIARQRLEATGIRAGNIRTILRTGDPATEVLELIHEMKPLMVVMGTHGRSGITRWFMGSVAETVIRQSEVPILACHVAA